MFKQVLDFYIRSSLHVAFCFVALSFVISGNNPSSVSAPLFYVLQFCLVLCAYNFMKYGDLVRIGRDFRFKLPVVALTVCVAVVGFVLLIPEFTHIYGFLTALIILGLLYTFPFIFGKNLRSFVFLKLPIVALSWTILIAAYINNTELAALRKYVGSTFCCFCNYDRFVWIDEQLAFLALGIFFFVFALCIPFEIRDIKYDKTHIQTLPQVLGLKRTKLLGYVSVIFALLFFNTYYNASPFALDLGLTHLYLICVVTCLSIYYANTAKSDYYASLFVEAIPVLWLVFYFIL
ncbi:MAG: hypothetical protein NWQ09_08115 [Nonlabens sp.]|nr:hypothetical protein [Nonlabens sp.]